MNPFKPIIDLFSRYIQLSPELLDYRHPEDDKPHFDEAGWFHGDVMRMPAHSSWYGKPLASVEPIAIVWHYTHTKPGTAKTMAKNRVKKRNPKTDRAASWHFTIDTDGSIWQMVSVLDGAWHVAKGQIKNPAAVRLVGEDFFRVNHCSVGIELVGDGTKFTPAQEYSAWDLAKTLADTYGITMANACRKHSEFDPERRRDPGPVWEKYMTEVMLPGIYEGRSL